LIEKFSSCNIYTHYGPGWFTGALNLTWIEIQKLLCPGNTKWNIFLAF